MAEQRDDFIIAIRSALLKRGAKQRYSLFFLISISTIIFVLDNSSFQYTKIARTVLNDAVYRVSSLASAPLRISKYTIEEVANFSNTFVENKTLKEELMKYKNIEFDAEFLRTENKSLKKLLNLVDKSDTYLVESHLARTILDKESPYMNSIIINKGSKSGFKKGMAVLKDDFLIGRIVEVNYFSSRVLLLNDLNSKIPVTLEPNNNQAILEGSGDGFLTLNYLPEEYILGEGNTVFTSGKDGFFLPGIPIGKTTLNKGGFYNVKLFAEINQLTTVRIIKTKKRNTLNFR